MTLSDTTVMALHQSVEEAGGLPLGGLLAEMGNSLRNNIYVYILYLRCEDAILSLQFTGLPITIVIAGKWLNSVLFHSNNKCITANR